MVLTSYVIYFSSLGLVSEFQLGVVDPKKHGTIHNPTLHF